MLDQATEGWALSYANLSPETERTWLGRCFLATNVAYALACIELIWNCHDYLLGPVLGMTTGASCYYHFLQLSQPDNTVKVQLALTLDYILAISSIGIGAWYLWQLHMLPSGEILATATLSMLCLVLGWLWENDDDQAWQYIWWHSLWHVLSAATAYQIGNTMMAAAATEAAYHHGQDVVVVEVMMMMLQLQPPLDTTISQLL
jgi:hypothetical protein